MKVSKFGPSRRPGSTAATSARIVPGTALTPDRTQVCLDYPLRHYPCQLCFGVCLKFRLDVICVRL